MNQERVMILIDSSNIHFARERLGGLLDAEKVIPFFKKFYKTDIVSVFYYTAYPGEGTRDSIFIEKTHKFLTFLVKKCHFVVRKKKLKVIESDNPCGKTYEKGNLDVEITIDVMRNLHENDTFVFFTGDSDFLPLITEILSEGRNAYIFSTRGAVSSELKTGGSGYYDICRFPEIIKKTPTKK